ncbi:hypothetical protein SAMN04488142_0545 [Halomonas sp. hl-4]|nr:hypothetical protein SAMN04488142_0545 [Halomonas sp. hl-4]
MKLTGKALEQLINQGEMSAGMLRRSECISRHEHDELAYKV